jgi:hypothetical protein
LARHVWSKSQICSIGVTGTWISLVKLRIRRGPDMSVLGADMFGKCLWNPARRPDMSVFSGKFGWRMDFDD